jgi:hypothetical protein
MKKIDLAAILDYHFSCREIDFPPNHTQKGYQMKLAIRIFVLSIVFAGVAAASVSSSSTTHVIASHQATSSELPVPGCGPGIPGCPPPGSGNGY